MQTANQVKEVLGKVKNVIYVHADHFEPATGDPVVCEEKLKIWTEDLKKLKVRPSLFVHPWLLLFYENGKVVVKPSSNTPVIVKYLKKMEENGADINLHIHHERWTTSSLTVEPWKTLLANRVLTDDQMLESYVVAAKRLFQEAGIDMTNWGFVHGLWALNASDKTACNITNELLLLKQHGCFGDFTFPAGRSHCNPSTRGIFSLIPQNRVKCYDKGDFLESGAKCLDSKRFIIFYPSHKYLFVALDSLLLNKGKMGFMYHSTLNPQTLIDGKTHPTKCPENSFDIVQEWILTSVIVAETLIIKTHAHSMNDLFWIFGDSIQNKSPLFHCNHIERMDVLEKMVSDQNVSLHYLTARDLYKFCLCVDKGNPTEEFFKGV